MRADWLRALPPKQSLDGAPIHEGCHSLLWDEPAQVENQRHKPRIAWPNFSTFAGPIPSISRSCLGFPGRIRATAVKVLSCITTYAGTRSRLASAARHSRKRIAKASPSADNSAGAASGCFPAPPLLTALLFFAGAGFPAWSTNSSTTPSLIKSSAQPPGRISSPASVSRTLRNRRTSPSFSYSASSISISLARHHRIQQAVKLIPTQTSRRVYVPLQSPGSFVVHPAQFGNNCLRQSLSRPPSLFETASAPPQPDRTHRTPRTACSHPLRPRNAAPVPPSGNRSMW